MQIYVQDLLNIKFSSITCYDTVSTYDTTIISFIINWCDTSDFCMHVMHDTSYDTTIVTSLMEQIYFGIMPWELGRTEYMWSGIQGRGSNQVIITKIVGYHDLSPKSN